MSVEGEHLHQGSAGCETGVQRGVAAREVAEQVAAVRPPVHVHHVERLLALRLPPGGGHNGHSLGTIPRLQGADDCCRPVPARGGEGRL